MKMLREVYATEPDQKIMCACGQPTCWHGIELSPDGFYFYPDASDIGKSYIFDFPEGLTLARFEDVEGGDQRYDHELEMAKRRAAYYKDEYDKTYDKLQSRNPTPEVKRILSMLGGDFPELDDWMRGWK